MPDALGFVFVAIALRAIPYVLTLLAAAGALYVWQRFKK